MFKYNKGKINRIEILKITILITFIILIGRLYYVQRIDSLIKTSSSVHNFQNEKISDNKSSLLDDKGKYLSENIREYRVVIDTKPFRLNNIEQNLESLIAFNFIMRSENKDFSFDEVLKKGSKVYFNISEDSYNKIAQLKNIKGIYSYIYNETNKGNENWKIENMVVDTKYYDNNGKSQDKSKDSLEQKLNEYTNTNKTPQARFSLNENNVYNEEQFDISDKNINIALTLDKELQEKVRSILNSDKYKDFNNAAAVLVEAKTGRVEALAQKDEKQANLITGAGGILGYEPGSIFKIITEEAAIEYGNVSLNDKYTCTSSLAKCKNHGTLTVKEALDLSCNDIFAKLGAKVGEEKILYLAKKQGLFQNILGLDSKNGIEAIGTQKESGINNLAIGQSICVTPIQMVGTISPVVNNGKYIKPYIVDSLVNQKGEVIKKFNTTYEQVIAPSTAKAIKGNMLEAVNKGTGVPVKINGVEIGGKTGTSETTKDGKKDFHGWFIGYFKKDNDYYQLAVFVPYIGDKNEDGNNTVGGNTAAPIFRDIVEEFTKK